VIADRLQQIARTCLSLRLKPGEAPLDAPSSRFGGVPWWPVDEQWPRCHNCGHALTLLCQLRLDGGGHWRPGNYELLTLFFCWPCDVLDERGSVERPSGDGCLIRLLRLAEQPLAPLRPPADQAAAPRLSACQVSGEPRLDVPDWQDVADELAASAPHALDTLHTCYLLTKATLAHHMEAEPRSQLGGYPHWLAASTWPLCRWCGGQMHLLAQLVTEAQASFDWGRGRRGFLFCCAEPCDPEALTLVLQSV
jgi:hypothetical protein